ncbi:MAG: D-alanyl-D-alanine carboxypeptidase [Oscillospiraceae bacterium]|nr:D-alanyl-D-alanine carboxypeptidase [Oscillospiraceae bacterium]
MENKNFLRIFLGVLCALAFSGLLLAGGLGMNALLLPGETEPSATEAPTDPPTEPPTQPPTEAPTEPPLTMPELSLTAKHSFIYLAHAQQFLMLKGNEDDRIYPASLTKLFSAYVALMYLDPETKVTAGSEVYAVPADSSIASLSPGDVLTVRQLVQAMLLASGGDAAMTLAAATGRKLEDNPKLSYSKAVARFVEEMNAVAAELGMSGSHFENPDGYHHENHYTTCADMQKIGTLALSHPEIKSTIGLTQVETPQLQRPYPGNVWKNTNFLLQPTSPHYVPTATGMKTGYTGAAGGCLLASFAVEGEQVLVGVFGCPTKENRFEDVCKIYNVYTN